MGQSSKPHKGEMTLDLLVDSFRGQGHLDSIGYGSNLWLNLWSEGGLEPDVIVWLASRDHTQEKRFVNVSKIFLGLFFFKL